MLHRAILVVDDEPDAAALFCQYRIGPRYQRYRLIVTHDGQQAIDLAREVRPEFIILDVLLPNQDGWEALQNLKCHLTTVDTSVSICSNQDARDLATLLGADGYMRKPHTENEFFDVLKRFGQ